MPPTAIKKIFIILISFSVIIYFGLLSPYISNQKFRISAAGNLESLSDVAASIVVGASHVEHEITFTLPRNATQIFPSDYIIVGMDNFSNIRSNILILGSFTGNPAATVSGQNVKITGISVLPGHTITIKGITADNPVNDFWLRVVITVTEDEAGNIIKNVGTVYMTKTSGQIAVTATISPPYASVRISGYSAPGTFITITENGTVIGTDTAGIAGLFSKYLTGISPGNHTFTIFGVDSSNRTTSLLDVSAITPIYQETSISNLLLSPTIELSTTSINQGDLLVTNGSSIINGNLSIFTEPHLRTYYATASATGIWSYTIDNTDEYIPGDYHIYSLVQNDIGSQSLFSNALQFSVISNQNGGSEPLCDLSRGDLNCDDLINLIDFSILMYYWGSTNQGADINIDDSVNLIDFSIMMYYWGT